MPSIAYVPLLGKQRHLHRRPPSLNRFREYMEMMTNDDRTDLTVPPLGLINPMAKQHVTDLLDHLLAIDADGIAADEIRRIEEDEPLPAKRSAAMVVVDDKAGGWTNRWDYESTLRTRNDPHGKRFWITGIIWSADSFPDDEAIRRTIRSAVERTRFQLLNGLPRNLEAVLRQEAVIAERSGELLPELDDDELAYSHDVIRPFLTASDPRTYVECLFGDSAADTLGFTARGLSPWAGLIVARRFYATDRHFPAESTAEPTSVRMP